MIVKMEKATIIILNSYKQETLTGLKNLGVMHIHYRSAESEELSILLEKKGILEKALKLIPVEKKKKTSPGKKSSPGKGVIPGKGATHDKGEIPPVKGEVFAIADDPVQIARLAISKHENIMALTETRGRLQQEYETLYPWGDFDPGIVRELREKGIDLHLCLIRSKDLDNIPGECEYIRTYKKNDNERLLFIGDPGVLPFSYKEQTLPEHRLSDLKAMIDEKDEEKVGLLKELRSLNFFRENLEKELGNLSSQIEFEQVRATMAGDEEVVHLTGFVPVDKTGDVKKTAKEKGWGLILESPGEDDVVPTLLKNPKWISIINPVFDFAGTIPGYYEADISLWFLLFFSLFFAIIIGDAGYGLCILGFTLFARVRMKNAPSTPFILFTVLGVCTVIWGALTGTWFGYEGIARLPFFSWMIIDKISSFPAPGAEKEVQGFIMLICFTIALGHLTLARVINFLKQLPSLKAFANIGKISLLWGLYFVIKNIVFKSELHPVAFPLLIAGIIISFIFTEQDGNFFKGLLSSLKNIIPFVLNSISCFSDIISYVRLFAVGLATVKVAEAFNEMAAGVGFGIPAVFISILILLAGHGLNMIMAGMSVLVHGMRLNMLEFSGHMDLQWSGIKYRPFSE